MKIPEFKLVRERLNLVHLTDLTLIRSWSGLTQIDAPNLERLELHSQREYRLPVVEDGGLLGTSLRPKSLSVHDDGTGSVLVPFLQGPFADIEELRVFSRVGWKEGSHLEKSLVDLLSDGMSWGQTVRWLTAVVPFGTGIPEADFDEIISRLEAMINRNRTTTRTINVRCSDMQHGW
ncbi:hypothetical protein FRC17_000314 [Serendipita sp. 399]|nr:hypothetical protein FRC17_000314 [Serendipita sp. 399]